MKKCKYKSELGNCMCRMNEDLMFEQCLGYENCYTYQKLFKE